ncbi:MAG: porin family protein [Chitinophagaceae bacterium]
MKKILLCLLIIAPACCFGQLKVAVKAGLNFANVTDEAGINANSRTGYMIGGYISQKPKKLLGFRSEIILSRQGYDYKTSTNTGTVNLDYLLLPQLITVNFGKKIQLHTGLQAAFLLNAKVDSSGNGNGSLFDYFNRFDYGFVGGAEVSPISGFFVGARINVSFNNVNKEAPMGGNWPNFLPKADVKNNVVQVYAGWRF